MRDRPLPRNPVWKTREQSRDDALGEPNRIANGQGSIGIKINRHPIVNVVAQAEEIIIGDNNG